MLRAEGAGTRVTQDKFLPDRAIAAVGKLKQAGILFAITSGRPPRGMSMLIEPLGLSTPIAAFNGGGFVRPDMSVIEQRGLPDNVTPAGVERLRAPRGGGLGLPGARLFVWGAPGDSRA